MMTAFASVELAVEAMKLGATDFLRKPMTPEIVRNAVFAAKPKSTKPAEERGTAGYVSHVTMNGFTILQVSYAERGKTDERRFSVQRPDGSEQEVVVKIEEGAFKAADQIAQRASITASFWTEQAKLFLSDFIWNNGDVPATGRMVLKSVEPEQLLKLVRSE
jgi:DNA-binding response OmpR family regulator